MRMYSPEELDVMAEAYDRALEKAPQDISSTADTQRLVQEIAWRRAGSRRDCADSRDFPVIPAIDEKPRAVFHINHSRGKKCPAFNNCRMVFAHGTDAGRVRKGQ